MNNRGHNKYSGLITRRAILIAVCMAFFLCLSGQPSFSQTSKLSEYQLKAVFIYKFFDFANWPSKSDPSRKKKTITIGVLGKSPFDADAFKAREGKLVPLKGKKLAIKYIGEFKKDTKLDDCNMLFISSSEKENFKAIIDHIGTTPILTIADSDGFLKAGGMIKLVLKGRKVRWELNDNSIKKSSLKLDSQLYTSAVKIIKD